MKYLSFLKMGLLIAAVGFLPIDGLGMGSRVPAVGTTAEDFRLADLDGKQQSLSQYRGKVVLVNFWATWCVPCVKEMPGLDRLAGRIGPERFTVLALSLDGPSRPKVAPFIESKGLKRLEVRFDARRAAFTALGVSVLPTSVLFDAEGREVGRLVGDAEWDSPEAEALVRHVLDARS